MTFEFEYLDEFEFIFESILRLAFYEKKTVIQNLVQVYL
jgi:hypothetical protein